MTKLFNMDKEKMENFWYYNKWYVAGIIFLLIIISVTAYQCANMFVIPDVALIYFEPNDEDSVIGQLLSDQINSDKIADVNEDGKIETIIISVGDRKNLDESLESDLVQAYILDKSNFLDYARQGFLKPVNELAAKYGVSSEKNPEILIMATNSEKKHIYGIPLKDNKLLDKVGYKTGDKYLVLRDYNTGENDEEYLIRYQNTMELVNQILGSE